MPTAPSESFVARQPDYTLSMIDKVTGAKGNIGVAWNQADGSIRIKFNAFVRVPDNTNDLVLTLFPGGRSPKLTGSKAPKPRAAETSADDYGSEDIPF